jgi:hypothetical protein
VKERYRGNRHFRGKNKNRKGTKEKGGGIKEDGTKENGRKEKRVSEVKGRSQIFSRMSFRILYFAICKCRFN